MSQVPIPFTLRFLFQIILIILITFILLFYSICFASNCHLSTTIILKFCRGIEIFWLNNPNFNLVSHFELKILVFGMWIFCYNVKKKHKVLKCYTITLLLLVCSLCRVIYYPTSNQWVFPSLLSWVSYGSMISDLQINLRWLIIVYYLNTKNILNFWRLKVLFPFY